MKKDNGNGDTQPRMVETPKIGKKEKLDLFMAYDKADTEVVRLEAALEKAREVRSAAVKAVHDACGAGPFAYKGKELRVMHRGHVYFFRGQGTSDLEVIG